MSDDMSPLDRIIQEGLKAKPVPQRIAELEKLLERSKLDLKQQRKVHEELADLRKRLVKR